MDRATTRACSAAAIAGRARAGAARSSSPRAAVAAAGACGAARARRLSHQHPQPALALGFLRPRRAHLFELAARPDAALGERLHPRSRAHAFAPDGPFAILLAAGRGRVPGLPQRTVVAAATRPFFALNR